MTLYAMLPDLQNENNQKYTCAGTDHTGFAPFLLIKVKFYTIPYLQKNFQ